MDSRSSSALFKRAEQLKRWQDSATNRQSPNPKHAARIQFSTGTVFLAACKAGDKEEIQRLLSHGADINTRNVDGLTALHQACIDDNMDMVEFLVSHGADVNQRDNEGWTPLHATASCGIESIARYLIENGADVAAVNYDGELPIDLAEIPESMRVLLRQAIDSQGIDCDKFRKAESTALLMDARQWAKYGYVEVRDPNTGGTPLHVAAAKGYLEVAQTLLENCKVDVNSIDYEGWTPLHAAALWGQKEVAALLINNGAKVDIKNYSGQTCVEVVDPKIAIWLKEAAMTARRKLLIGDTRGSFRRGMTTPAHQSTVGLANGNNEINNVTIRRTHSFETDKSFSACKRHETERVKASSWSSIPPMSPQSMLPSSSVERKSPTSHTNKDIKNSNKEKCVSPTIPLISRHDTANVTVRRNSSESVESNTSESTPSSSTPTKLSPGNIFKNFFKTFVPPIRDDESETQRKAHAKRVRETRRSTQGVTLDEIKSAEQLVKNNSIGEVIVSTATVPIKLEYTLTNTNADTSTSTTTVPKTSDYPYIVPDPNTLSSGGNRPSIYTCNHNSTAAIESLGAPGTAPASATATASVSASTIVSATASATTSASASATAAATIAAQGDRRPSWRLRLDPIHKESVATAATATTEAHQEATEATVFVRRTQPSSITNKTEDDKETEKRENEGAESLSVNTDLASCTISTPATQSAQNVIQRRRRSKRRSTGVGQVEFEDSTNNQGASGDGEVDFSKTHRSNTDQNSHEGDVDYKSLYEEALLEIKKLQMQLSNAETKIMESDNLITEYEKRSTTQSDSEKREKRAMVRKLSEMEEELKNLTLLQVETQRLRDENSALIRVISKLSK